MFHDFKSNITDAWQNLSFHVMADGDVDRVVFVQLINVDGEVILIITDSLSCSSSVFVDELTLDGVYLHRFFFPVVAVGVDALFYDEGQSHKRISTCDAKS